MATRNLQMVAAASITDDEVADWLATRPADARVRTLDLVGRDSQGRPMLRLDAEGLEGGEYSIGRVLAMLSGSDKAPRRNAGRSPAPLPEDPDAQFKSKTSARQMTDGELEWIEEMLGAHPHVSPDAAADEAERRRVEQEGMDAWERRGVQMRNDGIARNDERVAAIRSHGLPDDGLPTLKGSLRQVAYALEIRTAFAQSRPGDRALKAARTAKYWIDNHKAILRPQAH